MIICAGENESIDGALAVGIGLIDTAIKLTRICLQEKPSEVVFIGSAGSYGKYDVFDIVESSKASNIEISSLYQQSYSPLSNIISIENVSHETNEIVNSSNFITTDHNAACKFKELGMMVENMEFYSVLKVCTYFNIKAKGIFVITNKCDKSAHSDFLKNHNKAKELMENIVNEYK